MQQTHDMHIILRTSLAVTAGAISRGYSRLVTLGQ
jgi:hypothetical protein